MFRGLLVAIVALAAIGVAPCSAQTSPPTRVNVHLVTDEAEAVLAILRKRKTNQPPKKIGGEYFPAKVMCGSSSVSSQ
jgi:hypothetical protein